MDAQHRVYEVQEFGFQGARMTLSTKLRSLTAVTVTSKVPVPLIDRLTL